MEPLDDTLWFPEPNAEELVAAGGDLSTKRLLLAYRSGIPDRAAGRGAAAPGPNSG